MEFMKASGYFSNQKLEDCAKLQLDYRKMLKMKRLTKKNICELVIPFRDKYALMDSEALLIARNEISKEKLFALLDIH